MSSETISENKLASIASLKISNDVDLVRSYLRDIGRVPLLSHEQEITLGRQVQEYMQVERAELEIIELTGENQILKSFLKSWIFLFPRLKKGYELDSALKSEWLQQI